jgi:hypothetical protein
MRCSIRLSCLLAAFLLFLPHGLLAATYIVDAAATSQPDWTVEGSIEFDGSSYTDWNLVSDSPTYGLFTYTPANSSLAAASPFFTSTNLGAQNFALDASGANPDGGFLWLRFDEPLTGVVLDETTIAPGGITNGSCDSRYSAADNTWYYVPMGGAISEEGAVPVENMTWGHLKAMY